jgi:plastocyanin
METLYGDAAAIAEASGLTGFDPQAPLPTETVIALPGIEAYIVQGQSLAGVASTLSGATAASLAEANGLEGPDTAARVGASLAYPEDAWGSAPPDTLTSPSVCIEHALPDSIYETLPGVGTPQEAFDPEPPDEVSADVSISAGANEWFLVADGAEAEANRGVALVAPGTTVPFAGDVGLHTITINGEKDNGDLMQGDTRTITFDEPGEYTITCDYHPDMLAVLFVGEQ